MCHQVQKRKVTGNREGWGRSVADLCATRYKKREVIGNREGWGRSVVDLCATRYKRER